MLEEELWQEEKEDSKKQWVFLSLLLVIILLSLVFELARSALVRKFKKNHEILGTVNALFKELSVLGFVGLIAMLLVKTGMMEVLSRQLVTGAEEVAFEVDVSEDAGIKFDITDQFEVVHILIFLVMLCFSVLVIILLVTASLTERTFQEAEKVESKRLLLEIEQNRLNLYKRIVNVEKIQYRILRREFFRPTFGKAPPGCKPAKFNFSKYLGICMADFIVELIEVPPTTWLSTVGFVCGMKPFLGLKGIQLMNFLLFCSWTLFFMLACLTWSIGSGFRLCLPEFCPSVWEPNPTSGDKEKKSTTPIYYRLPAKKAQSCWEVWIRGTKYPMKQELCFTLWRNGPVLNTFLIRFHVFSSSVLCAVYLNLMLSQPELLIRHLGTAILQWMPFLVGLVLLWPRLLMFHTVLTATGMMLKQDAIQRTVLDHIQASLDQYAALTYELNTHALIHHIVSMPQDEYDSQVASYETKFEVVFNHEERVQIVQGFTLWDSSDNGLLDEEEFANFLQTVWGKKEKDSCRIAFNWFNGKVFGPHRSKTPTPSKSRRALRETTQTSILRVLSSVLRSQSSSYMPVPGIDSDDAIEIDLTQLKVLVVLLKEIDQSGASLACLESFLASLQSGGGDTEDVLIIETNDFLRLEPLRGAAIFAGIATESEIQKLFFEISSPEKEDQVVTKITLDQLFSWIQSLREVARSQAD